MACAHHGLDNVTAIVDVNALQADGPTEGVLRTEPVLDKWRAFGWHALRVDGNDIAALIAAFDEIAEHRGSPSVLICDTRIGYGVPLLMEREKAHFMRVEEHEWQIAHHGLDNVTAIVDVNALQADGPTDGILRTEPVTDKWQAFGWHAVRVDGNDVEALVDALDALREHRGSPAVLVCDTRIGRGVPLLETREKAHFMRVEADEWAIARRQLQEGLTR